jgi:membrane fusion protein (multidrug efflux system)
VWLPKPAGFADQLDSAMGKSLNGFLGRAAIWGVALLLLALGGLGMAYWWLFLRERVSTDNAYVVADTARVSARVPGRVQRVLAENDQPVEQGQLLLELDPADYRVALEKAEASLARMQADIQAAEALLSLTDRQTAAQVDAARTVPPETRDKRSELLHRLQELRNKREAALADFQEAERDKERFDSLFAAQVVAQRQRDQVLTAFNKARAQLEAVEAEMAAVKASIQALDKTWSRARAQLEAAESDRSQVEVQEYRLASLRAQAREARAAVDAARLNLSYCSVRAPISGYVAQKNVQVGEHVQAGQPLMAIVPLQEVYVEANFKETQLTDVRLGQPAEIRADMYPGYVFRGVVAGIRSGTGAAFSLLPPENATGNWIKVVQRIPVRILLESPPPRERPLRIGTSLKVTIHTHEKGGGLLVGSVPGS